TPSTGGGRSGSRGRARSHRVERARLTHRRHDRSQPSARPRIRTVADARAVPADDPGATTRFQRPDAHGATRRSAGDRLHCRHHPRPGDRTTRRPGTVPLQLTRFGYYVHVPFCARRCDYCAFATWTDRDHLVDSYLHACRTDVERMVSDGAPLASSVFVGGGTPSLVPAASLIEILDVIPRHHDTAMTIDCNP